MGTSTARRGPTGRLWRLAKGAATRYLSPEAGAPVSAGEVAARYVAALGEGQPPEAGALSAFRLTRKTAQNLGDFVQVAVSRGVPAAFEAQGLTDLVGQPQEAVAQGLASAWLGAAGGLEEAVARSALLTVLAVALDTLGKHSGPSPQESSRWVRRFLAEAVYRRLLFDLGESLEAAAPGLGALERGFVGIAGEIDEAAGESGQADPAFDNWRGLTGWQQVTRLLANLLNHLLSPHREPGP